MLALPQNPMFMKGLAIVGWNRIKSTETLFPGYEIGLESEQACTDKIYRYREMNIDYFLQKKINMYHTFLFIDEDK